MKDFRTTEHRIQAMFDSQSQNTNPVLKGGCQGGYSSDGANTSLVSQREILWWHHGKRALGAQREDFAQRPSGPLQHRGNLSPNSCWGYSAPGLQVRYLTGTLPHYPKRGSKHTKPHKGKERNFMSQCIAAASPPHLSMPCLPILQDHHMRLCYQPCYITSYCNSCEHMSALFWWIPDSNHCYC